MLRNSEIDALINLLDDPDESVFAVVRERFLEQGKSAVDSLKSALQQQNKPIVHQRITDIIMQMQNANAKREFTQWIGGGSDDALKGMYCIAKFFYTDLEYPAVTQAFEKIAADIQAQIEDEHTVLQKIKIINRTLFKKYKFRNNFVQNLDIDGYFIHLALERRSVNFISLTLLYLCFARRLSIPMRLVCLPENYIFLCDNKFYVNPALNGQCFDLQILPCSDSPLFLPTSDDTALLIPNEITLIFHLVKMLKELYDKQNQYAESRQIAPALQLLAERMGMDYPLSA